MELHRQETRNVFIKHVVFSTFTCYNDSKSEKYSIYNILVLYCLTQLEQVSTVPTWHFYCAGKN